MAESSSATISSSFSCKICSEIYKSNEDVLCTNCGHVFHKTCYQKWMRRSQTCPECRSENPQTQDLYLHIKDPTEVENINQRSQPDLVNKVLSLERPQEESEQHLCDAQRALTIAYKEIDELKQQLEYSKVLNSCYKQRQMQTRASIKEVQDALARGEKQLDELEGLSEYINELNANYEKAQAQVAKTLREAKRAKSQSEAQVRKLQCELQNLKVNCVQEMKHVIKLSTKQMKKLHKQLELRNAQIFAYDKAIETLMLQNENKIKDLQKRHAVVEKWSEDFREFLTDELENKKIEVAVLERNMKKLRNERKKRPTRWVTL